MRKRLRLSFVTAWLVTAVVTAAAAQGPMSSTKPPEVPAASTPAATGAQGDFDVNRLFANTCGWCHSNGGRAEGKGPKLMGTALSDAEIIHRIKVGKPGAMPAFASSFTDDQLKAIVRYIRSLHE